MKFNMSYIPKVDVIKSGYTPPPNDLTARVEDGHYVIAGRNRASRDARDRALALEIQKQEEELSRLRKAAKSYGYDKDDIKEIQKDVKKEKEWDDREDRKSPKNLDPYFAALIDGGVVPRKISDYLETGDENYSKKKKKKEKKRLKKLEEERAKLQGFRLKNKPEKFKKREIDPNDAEQKARDEIQKDFQEIDVISKSNLAQINETISFVESRINELTENGERMNRKDYIISNYLNTLSSLITAKQGIAKDISANKAKVYDIQFKMQKNKGTDPQNDADLISRLFPKLVMNGNADKLIDAIDESQSKSEKKKKKKKKWKDDIVEDDELEAREHELMKSGMLEYTDYEKNIEYEGKFDIVVYYNFQDGDFCFGAVDKADGHRVKVPKDYLPSKKGSKLRFDEEQEIAYDVNTARTYKLISVPVLPNY